MKPLASNAQAKNFLLISAGLDSVGLGIIVPVLPELLMELTGAGLGVAAEYGGWLLMLYAGIQFLIAPVLGSLSDRFGRRPVLLVSLFAFSLDYLAMALAPTLAWLFIARAIAGVCGATYSTLTAYIADTTGEEERAKYIGYLSAAWGVGFIFGPAIGGLLGELGPRVPFYVASAVCFLNFVYGYLVLPESLGEDNRRPFSLIRANTIGAIFHLRGSTVLGLLAAYFFYQIAHDSNPSVWSFFTIERFGWSEFQVGLSVAFVGVMIAIANSLLVAPAIKLLGERRAIPVGYACQALGFIGFAFSTHGWQLILSIVPFALGAIGSVALRSHMTKQVAPDQQGELQGAIASIMGLGAILAPPVMTQLFGYYTSPAAPVYFPGVSFALAALCTLLCVVICMAKLRERVA
ncbi:MAG: TCR/Tet family MFS transporter [Gammaproteobacteria bacterium]|nr:TCR/Tet family MFS transporter [Gammaproteobacteria bacterium]